MYVRRMSDSAFKKFWNSFKNLLSAGAAQKVAVDSIRPQPGLANQSTEDLTQKVVNFATTLMFGKMLTSTYRDSASERFESVMSRVDALDGKLNRAALETLYGVRVEEALKDGSSG